MPPKQCPECGRFLKNALMVELATGAVPCPKCEVELTGAMFGLEAPPSPAAEGATAPPPVAPSIRPPDLRPESVRDPADPLAGWDAGVPLPEVRDQRPFPTDTVVVLAGAVAGAVAGTLATDRPTRGGALGALAGAAAAGVVRRVWTLPDA